MKEAVKKDLPGPLVLITGEEEFLVAEQLKKMKDRLIDPGLSDFNYHLFYGSLLEVEEILNIAQTFPLLSEKRLVIVKETDLIPSKELEKLLPYLDNPSPSTCLVFVAAKADMRKSFFIRFKEKGKVISCGKLYENQVGPWIRNLLREASLEIEDPALLFLKTELGADLSRLSVELEKLKSFIGEKKKITIQDCKVLIRGHRSYTVFDLVNAVGNKNQTLAMLLLTGLLGEGEQPLVLLAMLVRHFRNLLKLGECQKLRYSRMEVSKRLGIPEFFLAEIYKHATLYSRSELEGVFRLCLEADFQLKGNTRLPDRVMEALILDLCGGGKPVYSSSSLQM
ncbi:MAG: DNA polymerase III subunit delta [Nitrospiria bacterium]